MYKLYVKTNIRTVTLKPLELIFDFSTSKNEWLKEKMKSQTRKDSTVYVFFDLTSEINLYLQLELVSIVETWKDFQYAKSTIIRRHWWRPWSWLWGRVYDWNCDLVTGFDRWISVKLEPSKALDDRCIWKFSWAPIRWIC